MTDETIEKLIYELEAKVDKAIAGFEKVEKSIGDVDKKMDKSSKAMEKGAALVAKAWQLVAVTITAAIALMARATVKSSADMEAYMITLTNLYGDLETAGQKMEWLLDFAQRTPFELPGLIDSMTKLKAYGIEFETVIRSLGNAASALTKPLDAAVEALADAQTGEFERLKEFGIKAIEITKNNYEMLGATQEQIGLTALTYTDSQMQQAIKVIDRNNRQAITTAITGIFDEKYMGGMEALSKSAKGIWSNIWDSLYKGQLAFMGFDEATKQFREGSLFDRMKTGLGGVLDTVQNIDFEKAGQGVETFLGWMDKGKEILQPWTDAEKRINKAVFGILKDVKNALGTEITGDLDGLKLLLQDLYGAFVLLRRGAAYVFEYIDSHDIGGKFVLSFRLALESISAVYSWIHDKLVWALDEIITRYNSLVPLLQKAGIDAEVVSMDMFKPVKDSAKDAREEVKKEMDQVVADHRAAVDEMTGAAKGAEIIPGGRRSYAQIMGVDAAKAAGLSGVYGSMGIPAAKVSQTSTIPAADTEVTSTRITAIQSPTNIGFNLTSLITGIKDEFVAALKQEPRDVEINMNVVVRNESSMRNLQKQIGEATARGVSGKYTYS